VSVQDEPRVLHRAALVAVLVGLALRIWIMATHTYVVHPDETVQYLEQAHRLAFGSGLQPWEYIFGIRSWLLPGVLAAIFRAAALIDPAPWFYVGAARLLCVLGSLSVPYLAARWAGRSSGGAGALIAGLVPALWYELLYFAPVVLTERPPRMSPCGRCGSVIAVTEMCSPADAC
jgi:hypothetical protein